jgi:small basic protein
MSHPQFDTTSIEGVVLSITFIVLGKIFVFLNVIEFLQGFSYLMAIVIAWDTLFGGPLRTYLTSLYKQHKKKK